MTRHHAALPVLFAVIALVASGCSLGSLGSRGDAGLRPTNVEVRILSQSCFQGEIEPCG
jgi:hypothetical protein